MKKVLLFMVILLPFLSGCSSTKGPRPKAPEVTVAINVRGDNSLSFTNISLDSYLFDVKSALNEFQNVYLVYVGPEEKPQVTLDISINNLEILPTQTRTSRRAFSRTIQSGTNAAGKPVYETVSATVDIEDMQIPARANLAYKLSFKDNPSKTTQQRYYENYTWRRVSVGNIQGDARAVDPSIYTGLSSQIEPFPEEMLMILSRREMIRRISDDLRKYFPKPKT